ncbi:DUF3900 domain-containing protein [Brevibacillus fulvus]|uniref:DUF3898 domain-containing protein n=1 Tax=Brevibacillus fulvus TaxID=1125967 RepID=A0A938XUS1_9BACL|nr:DUF3900 domain-containing protein [Brevibacillus fulvus]MBM7590482.1 hypothetical protein [Brevibacillus fulvus]
MNFSIEWLTFYLIEQLEGESKQIRFAKTLSHDEYQHSELRSFLDGEFTRIAKRKVEETPRSEGSPTKLGRFVLAEGHAIDSNPNYQSFQRILQAANKEDFKQSCSELVQAYLRTSQVRGGVLLIVRAKLDSLDDRYVFLLKCDFEQKTAVITDESSLIANVQMAINAKNMKSIMYPLMIEPGLNDHYHVKIHQFSHARYFEDFLKFIEFPQTIGQIVTEEVLSMAKQQLDVLYPEPSEERMREEEAFELMAASPKRELSEKWEHETVMEAMQLLTDRQPDLELRFKLDHIQIRALLADYGTQVHIAKANGRYLVLLSGDSLQFEKGISPVELLKPKNLREIVRELENRPSAQAEREDVADLDTPPW